jgi:ADP-ribose pyrophosphatase YjhB (NUDIX family)
MKTGITAIFIRSGKILVVREPRESIFKFPGGGNEHGELYEQTLRRELKEELNIKNCSLRHWRTFVLPKTEESEEFRLVCYMAETDERPETTADIEEMKWVNKIDSSLIYSIREVVMPELLKEKML